MEASSMADPLVGIDLGTSSCSVACMVDGKPQVLPVFDGREEMPTYVAFTSDGERLVGWPAKRQSIRNPANTIYTIKRLIGRKFGSTATQAELGLLPYRVIPSGSGGLWVEAGGRTYTPTEITAMMLAEVRRATEAYLGSNVTKAIITVPAYFDEGQRRATTDAAEIAGIEVLRLLVEPTAAALAQWFRRENQTGTIAVYDLGGGTFDISILEIGDGVFEVKAVSGDNRLGGEDFDHILVRHFVEQLHREYGIDLAHNPLALHRIKDAAEQIKIYLDVQMTASVELPYLAVRNGQFLNIQLKLNRELLERLFADLIERTLEPCREALRGAELTADQLDALVLVGGMSRMPVIQRRVAEFFGRAPVSGVDPSRIVAYGAAIQASVLGGGIKDVLLLNVVPMSLGYEDYQGKLVPVIPRNCTIPTRRSSGLIVRAGTDLEASKQYGRQELEKLKKVGRQEKPALGRASSAPKIYSLVSGSLKIVQGDAEYASGNLLLKEIPLGVATEEPNAFELTFEVDANDIIIVELKNTRTNEGRRHIIRASDPFSRDFSPGLMRKQFSEEHLAAVRAQADELLNVVDAAIEAHRTHIHPKILANLAEAREGLQRAMQGRDAAELRGALIAFAETTNMKLSPREPIHIPAPIILKAAPSNQSIFISYARVDIGWLERLRIHLSPLERDRKVEIWHDGKIETGTPWELEIATALNQASAAILLVSANFMASKFIYENELPPILQRHRRSDLAIFPVIIGHCLYTRDPALSRLNAFNDPKRPLSSMSEGDAEALLARLAGNLWQRLRLD